MEKKLSRRTLLKAALLASGGTLAACMQIVQETVDDTIPNTAAPEMAAPEAVAPKVVKPQAAAPTTTTHLPLVQNVLPSATPSPQVPPTRTPLPPGSRSRVVHVHANNAHNWNNSAQNYWDYVNQGAVDNMVDQGVMNMTGQRTAADAWRSLMPNYTNGQSVAIKVSFNNTDSISGSVNMIDGIIEPVNAIIRGLHAAGVGYSSIVVFDSSRVLPTRFTSNCPYAGVQFKDKNHSPWGSTMVTFTPPGVSAFTQSLSNVVADADYLINVPIMKLHSMAKLSLAMKNHYGTVQYPKPLHDWSSTGSPHFTTQYNPIVDINKNSHIADKTILTVGDGIFAAFHNYDRSFPQVWATFGQQTPKSLFFSADPVAIDCVMGDLLHAEGKGGGVIADAFAYLQLAERAGLGIFDRGNPWQDNYTRIDYQKIEV